MHTIPVSDEVRSLLRRSTVTQDRLVFPPGQLDRALYEAVNKALDALGGKWNRSAKAHLFKTDPREAITSLVEGEKLVDKKKTFQAFFTPDAAADEVAQLAELRSGLRLLEPSAGNGQLVRAAQRVTGGLYVHTVEVNPDHFHTLAQISNLVSMADFVKSTVTELGAFDRVLMNPPFTKGQDVEHVVHAYDFLKPGGVLVAIVSPAFRFRCEIKFRKFRGLHEEVSDVETVLPAGTFKESGTGIATVLVRWRKP